MVETDFGTLLVSIKWMKRVIKSRKREKVSNQTLLQLGGLTFDRLEMVPLYRILCVPLQQYQDVVLL
jgi:hypothetical protein